MTAFVTGPPATTRRSCGISLTSRVFFIAATLACFPLAAAAAEPAIPLDPPRHAQAPEPLCFCWNDGRKIAEGSAACIRTTQGRRMALCGRVINMMSWQVTENPCPES
ncbi:hypothetical protein ABIE41_000044 [Bosea sp. OAE506]|uniref:hypothetical protein n=1 Tax=Bosea sp. OAE506 TaxID=2663870 RepID=UPI00178A19C2